MERDEAAERDFFERAKKYYSKRRSGIHLSDLVRCLRVAYWNRIDPIPPNDDDALFFILGSGHHSVIQEIFGEAAEVRTSLDGISMTIDVLDGDVPTELKTTRSSVDKHDQMGIMEAARMYADQTAGYAAAKESMWGRLFVFHLLGKWNPPKPVLRAYKVRFESAQDREDYVNWLKARRDLLVESWKTNTIPPGPRFKFECVQWHCKFAERCVSLGLLRKDQTWLADEASGKAESIDLRELILPTCQCGCGCSNLSVRAKCNACGVEGRHRAEAVPPRQGWVKP